jgi:hypothetical protein
MRLSQRIVVTIAAALLVAGCGRGSSDASAGARYDQSATSLCLLDHFHQYHNQFGVGDMVESAASSVSEWLPSETSGATIGMSFWPDHGQATKAEAQEKELFSDTSGQDPVVKGNAMVVSTIGITDDQFNQVVSCLRTLNQGATTYG